MKKSSIEKIFGKYNPISDVVRCPYGKGKLKETLDLFALASISLYGIIEKEEFVKIFNDLTNENITVEEMYILLLPNVIKYRMYCFYENYLLSFIFYSDLNWVEDLLRQQGEKPRFIPKTKEEFLLYEDPEYEDNDYWFNLHVFLLETFGLDKYNYEVFLDLKNLVMHDDYLKQLFDFLDYYKLSFKDENEINHFLALLTDAKNNTRIWENKGHTPIELRKKYMAETDPDEITYTKDIPLEDICYCGSTRKYKNCCYIIEKNKKAQLSESERKLFYKIWYRLLDYVNKVLGLNIPIILEENGGGEDDRNKFLIRQELWKSPELIDSFLMSDVEFSEEEISLLKSWKKGYRSGFFVAVAYNEEYTVFAEPNDKKLKFYAVKGVSRSVGDALRRRLPAMLETVLLPFKDKIVYDTYLLSSPISIVNKEILADLKKQYLAAIRDKSIITKLVEIF